MQKVNHQGMQFEFLASMYNEDSLHSESQIFTLLKKILFVSQKIKTISQTEIGKCTPEAYVQEPILRNVQLIQEVNIIPHLYYRCLINRKRIAQTCRVW